MLDHANAFLTHHYAPSAWLDDFLSHLLRLALVALATLFLYKAVSNAQNERSHGVNRRTGILLAFPFSVFLLLLGKESGASSLSEFIKEEIWRKTLHSSFAALTFLCDTIFVLARIMNSLLDLLHIVLEVLFLTWVASASLCASMAWTVIYLELMKYFCSCYRYWRSPSKFRSAAVLTSLEGALKKHTALEDAFSRSRAQLPPFLPNVRLSIRTPSFGRVRTLWLSLTRAVTDDELWDMAHYLEVYRFNDALPPTLASEQDKYPSSILSACLEAARATTVTLLCLRRPPLKGYKAEVVDLAYRLAGGLVKHFLPFHPLLHLAQPFPPTLMESILFTPFGGPISRPSNPEEWARQAETLPLPTDAPHPSLSALLEAMPPFFMSAALLGVTPPHAEALLTSMLRNSDLLDEMGRSEERLHEAVLDAVLLWKEAKEEKGRRVEE